MNLSGKLHKVALYERRAVPSRPQDPSDYPAPLFPILPSLVRDDDTNAILGKITIILLHR